MLLLVRLDVGPWPREPSPRAKALGAKSLLTSLISISSDGKTFCVDG